MTGVAACPIVPFDVGAQAPGGLHRPIRAHLPGALLDGRDFSRELGLVILILNGAQEIIVDEKLDVITGREELRCVALHNKFGLVRVCDRQYLFGRGSLSRIRPRKTTCTLRHTRRTEQCEQAYDQSRDLLSVRPLPRLLLCPSALWPTGLEVPATAAGSQLGCGPFGAGLRSGPKPSTNLNLWWSGHDRRALPHWREHLVGGLR